MSVTAADVPPAPESATVHEAGADGGLMDDLRMLWQQLLGLAHDRLQLAVLETRLAGQSLVAMVAAGVMVALLVVSAWLALLAAVIAVLVSSGIAFGAAILLGAGANLLVALLLCAFIRRMSRHLLWTASLRGLRGVTATRNSNRGST